MEDEEHRFPARVLDKTKGKVGPSGKEPVEANCYLTDNDLIIETEQPTRIPVARIENPHLSVEMPYGNFARIQKGLSTSEITLIYYDDLYDKHSLSMQMNSGDATSFNYALKAALTRFARASKKKRPSRFGDPIAKQTDWTRVNEDGLVFATYKLVKVSDNRIEFRASIDPKVLCVLLLLAGIGVGIGFFAYGLIVLILSLFGLFCAYTAGSWLYSRSALIVFDKLTSSFTKGRKAIQSLKNFVEIDQIHALQLISKRIQREGGMGGTYSFYRYELNLILTDGKRINVVDDLNKWKVRKQAKALSEFLGRPVWDAIRHRPS